MMYKLLSFKKKIWLLVIISISFFSAFSFAKDDCENIFSSTSLSLFSGFLSENDLEIARNHLRSYCCVEKPNLAVLSWKCDNLVLWAESPYWYDHLVDVGLRKLDAESLYPWMSWDLQWSEWRDFVKDTEAMKTPELFQKKYIKYWAQSWTYLFSSYAGKNYTDSLRNILSWASQFNLHDKYINHCFLAMIMYYTLVPNHIDIVADWYYGRCLSMVKSRIRQETSLAIMISEYNAASLLVDGLTSYTKQFVQSRLMKLFDKLVAISSLFNTLAKQAPLSDTCTK